MSAVVRYVFARLTEQAAPRRAELVDTLCRSLGAAGADAEVGVPADDSASRWDLAIAVRCADLATWQALAARPAVAAALGPELERVAVVVKAWTFTAEPTVPRAPQSSPASR
ncbi:MAG: hypothetical protein R2939_09850 [Kofleriaceae bacterium]